MSLRWVDIGPVAGNVRAAGEPDSFMLRGEIKKTHHGFEPCRLARNPAVKADSHHPRAAGALRIEHAQRGGEVIMEIVCRAEFGGGEPVIVVGETVRNDEVRPL